MLCGECTGMIPSASGDIFLDGVRFWFLHFSLRVQFQIVLVGAMPIDAYRIIRNPFIRLIGAANPIRPRREEIA